MTAYKKETLSVLHADSLRELVETVNGINETTPSKILKDDIIEVFREEDGYFMLYYK